MAAAFIHLQTIIGNVFHEGIRHLSIKWHEALYLPEDTLQHPCGHSRYRWFRTSADCGISNRYPTDPVIFEIFPPDNFCVIDNNIILFAFCSESGAIILQWRHNEGKDISNHQPHDCLLNCLFRRNENIKALRHWPLWGEFTGDRWNSPHKGSVTRKMFPFDDVISLYATAGVCFANIHCRTKNTVYDLWNEVMM